jgi:hypothetical protein
MGLLGKIRLMVIEAPRSTQEIRPRGDSYARISGKDYAIRGWTPRGFHVAPYVGDLVARQFADVTLVVRDFNDPDGEWRVDDGVVVDCIDESGLHAHWWLLPDRKKLLIEAYFAKKSTACQN